MYCQQVKLALLIFYFLKIFIILSFWRSYSDWRISL